MPYSLVIILHLGQNDYCEQIKVTSSSISNDENPVSSITKWRYFPSGNLEKIKRNFASVNSVNIESALHLHCNTQTYSTKKQKQ